MKPDDLHSAGRFFACLAAFMILAAHWFQVMHENREQAARSR